MVKEQKNYIKELYLEIKVIEKQEKEENNNNINKIKKEKIK